MNIYDLLADVNYLSVLFATIASFVVGYTWYAPAVFGNKWIASVEKTREDIEKGDMKKIFFGTFIATYIIGIFLSMVLTLTQIEGVLNLLGLAFVLAVVFCGMIRKIHALYEQRNKTYMFITIGFDFMSIFVMLLVLSI